MAIPRRLRVAGAYPDPPFDIGTDPPTGLDIDLAHALAAELGSAVELQRYPGADFDGIFSGLGRTHDLVVSGATVTPHRRTLARWCTPYVHSGQSLVVAPAHTPQAHDVDGLGGLVLGVQRGNTSEPVARRLRTKGAVADVRVYAYDAILAALADVESGVIGAFMKLEPVMRELTRGREALRIVQTGITREDLAVAVALGADDLARAIDGALDALRRSGDLARIADHWLAECDPATTGIGAFAPAPRSR
jgi:polar amino acid transport system substrate-binding protein